jgi:hypothetical protein
MNRIIEVIEQNVIQRYGAQLIRIGLRELRSLRIDFERLFRSIFLAQNQAQVVKKRRGIRMNSQVVAYTGFDGSEGRGRLLKIPGRQVGRRVFSRHLRPGSAGRKAE